MARPPGGGGDRGTCGGGSPGERSRLGEAVRQGAASDALCMKRRTEERRGGGGVRYYLGMHKQQPPMHPASAMSPERADSRVKFLWMSSVEKTSDDVIVFVFV